MPLWWYNLLSQSGLCQDGTKCDSEIVDLTAFVIWNQMLCELWDHFLRLPNMNTNPVKVNSSFKDNFKEKSSDPTLLNFSKHYKEKNFFLKSMENDKEPTRRINVHILKIRYKIKMQKPDYKFYTTNTHSLVSTCLFIWNCGLHWACYNQAGLTGHPMTSEQQQVICYWGNITKCNSFCRYACHRDTPTGFLQDGTTI